MQADIRHSPVHQAVQALYRELWPADKLHGARDLEVVGSDIYFTGISAGQKLEAPHRSGLYKLSADGDLQPCWPGARMSRVSALLSLVACVHARGEGDDELRLLSLAGGEPLARWLPDGAIELLRWSPNGRELLILVAGRAADVAGVAGGFAMRSASSGPSWLPEVTTPGGEQSGRSLWVWTPKDAAPHRLTQSPCNPWEASWCGNQAVITVASQHHSEGSWYEAQLLKITAQGEQQMLRQPTDQLGIPVASDDGNNIAWIEAVCSDRGLVCGTVMFKNGENAPRAVDMHGVEVSDLQWRHNGRLLVAGMQGFKTVVAELDPLTDEQISLWSSDEQTLSGWVPQAVPIGEDGALVLMEGYAAPPAIVELKPGGTNVRLAMGPSRMPEVGRINEYRWTAADGLEILGWLILPPADVERPAAGWPLLVDVHGGPINAHRNRWAANFRSAPLLARQGWAVLLANPRGSSGRGQDFARQVVGDMGGVDAQDLLAGVDALVAEGVADSARLAITGTSYGGFMSCWLVTQTQRFAAAVPISPVTNWTSQHYGSQVPWFDTAFLRATPQQANGPYFSRSPVLHAGTVRTPTLVMGGGRDKNTPTGQANEFYNALVESGAPCALVVYPEDGHSLRGMPAYLDSVTRIVSWLSEHV